MTASEKYDYERYTRMCSLIRTRLPKPPPKARVVFYNECSYIVVAIDADTCFDAIATVMDECESIDSPIRALKAHSTDDWFSVWTWEAPGWRKHPLGEAAQRRTPRMRPTEPDDWR